MAAWQQQSGVQALELRCVYTHCIWSQVSSCADLPAGSCRHQNVCAGVINIIPCCGSWQICGPGRLSHIQLFQSPLASWNKRVL